MSAERYEGACYCGAVRIAVTGAPAAAGLCHCDSCRRWHAAPINAWAIWPDAAVEVVADGEGLLEFDRMGGGGPSGRSSCRRCGGAVCNRKPRIGMTVVYAAVLEGSGFAYAPTFHCYYGEGVLDVADGLPKFADLPKPLGGSGERLDEPARTGPRR